MGYFVAKQAHHIKDGRLPWKSLLWMWRLWSPLYLHSGYTSQNGQRRKWWQSIGFYGYLRQNLPVPLTKPYRCTNLSVLYPSPCISAWSCKASPGVWLWSDLPPKTLVNLVTSPTSLFTQKNRGKSHAPAFWEPNAFPQLGLLLLDALQLHGEVIPGGLHVRGCHRALILHLGQGKKAAESRGHLKVQRQIFGDNPQLMVSINPYNHQPTGVDRSQVASLCWVEMSAS